MRRGSTLTNAWFGLLLAVLLPAAVWAQPAPKLLRLCLNEVPHPPWRFADAQGRVAREGLDFFIAQQWAQRSGLEVQIALQPWKRCLADLKDGLQDAVLSMSHLPERDAIAVFPRTASGQLDEGFALEHFAEPAPQGVEDDKADRYRRAPNFLVMRWRKAH